LNSLPTVAVVILNWNGLSYLQQFLPSVLATTYPAYRLIVADNASTDDSLRYLEENYPGVERLVLPENYGFARGYNEALKRVEADYYLLLNSDVEVTPGWLEPMVELLESRPEVGACQPKVKAFNRKTHFEYAGACGGWIDAYGYPFARGRVFDFCEEDRGQYDTPQPVFWATGAAMLIRSSLFHGAGGFDPFFFAHMEEIDLCWRLQRAGHKVYCCPQSVVYHVGGGTLPQGNSRKTYLNFRNNAIMLAKNLPWSEKWWKLPFRLVLDGVAAFRQLLAGDGGYFKAVLRAQGSFLRWCLGGGGERDNTPKLPLRKLGGVYRGNLVWSFFVQGKKTYAALMKGRGEKEG
jgi:GT2 family glycosyltransferase